MVGEIAPPFSSRTRGAHVQIDKDFPNTTKIGLLHIIHDSLRRRYLDGWEEIVRELQRIGRIAPVTYGHSAAADSIAEQDAVAILMELPWDKAYDFCERLHSHLATEVCFRDDDGDLRVITAKGEVQQYLSNELQRLFLEENLAFEFKNGVVQRRGRRHTIDRISKAEVVLGDARLADAGKHYAKALRYFRDVSKPDPENAVKEAVCAVEAAGKALFPEAKAATLGDLVKWLTGNEAGKVPKTLAQTFAGLYGFRSGGVGVSHGGTSGGPVTIEIAEYALALAASQVILLVDLANAQEQDIPF